MFIDFKIQSSSSSRLRPGETDSGMIRRRIRQRALQQQSLTDPRPPPSDEELRLKSRQCYSDDFDTDNEEEQQPRSRYVLQRQTSSHYVSDGGNNGSGSESSTSNISDSVDSINITNTVQLDEPVKLGELSIDPAGSQSTLSNIGTFQPERFRCLWFTESFWRRYNYNHTSWFCRSRTGSSDCSDDWPISRRCYHHPERIGRSGRDDWQSLVWISASESRTNVWQIEWPFSSWRRNWSESQANFSFATDEIPMARRSVAIEDYLGTDQIQGRHSHLGHQGHQGQKQKVFCLPVESLIFKIF